MPGVRSANVNFAEEQAVVEYDPSLASIATMVAAVTREGYKSWDTAEEKAAR